MQLVICRDGDQAGLRTGDEPSRTAERASGNSLAEFVDLPPTPCEVAQSRQPQDVINRVQPANATARCGLYGRGNPPLAGPVVELAIRDQREVGGLRSWDCTAARWCNHIGITPRASRVVKCEIENLLYPTENAVVASA